MTQSDYMDEQLKTGEGAEQQVGAGSLELIRSLFKSLETLLTNIKISLSLSLLILSLVFLFVLFLINPGIPVPRSTKSLGRKRAN